MTQRSQIIEILTALPGSTQAEINSLMPDYKNPSGEVAWMMKKGMIRAEKLGKHNHYYLTGNTDAAKAAAVSKLVKPPVVKPKTEPVLTKPDSGLVNEELIKELKELREFKAMAIAKYPGLQIKPEIIEGRKILVEFFTRTGETTKVEQAKNGNLDHTPMMQVTILALDK